MSETADKKHLRRGFGLGVFALRHIELLYYTNFFLSTVFSRFSTVFAIFWLLSTPFIVPSFAMHRDHAYCIISCVDCLGISMHKFTYSLFPSQNIWKGLEKILEFSHIL